jgi:UDP-N-acetylmuramoyl-L-alanyl-D-glutamate--2,6-diaminopimelate ligase
MKAGLADASSVRIIPDRAEAIAAIVGSARPGDVVLLAGKGHEESQEIRGVHHPFSDREHARQALATWKGGSI